jgi:peptidoglycan/LPS O-acetylase OafA/YrhL
LSRGDALSGMGYGLARVAFAYFVGVMIFRLHQNLACLRSIKAPPLILATMILTLSISATAVPALIQIGVIALVFPAIILLGANHDRAGRLSGLYSISGRLSYPFYVLHVPVMVTIMGFLKWRHLYYVPWVGWYGVPIAVGIAGVSLMALRHYDEPLRRWLSEVMAR